MPAEKEYPKKVTYKLEPANGFQVIYVNGAWGGVTFLNNIRMELYSESIANPDLLIHEATNEGKVGNEIDRIPSMDPNQTVVLRQIHVAAIIQPDIAEAIGKWLIEQAKQAKGEQK
jgi:hypothetical protein